MPAVATPLTELSQYIEACTDKYEACIECLDETKDIDGFDATLRFHHLRFDANGQPKFKDLAEVLADHIIEYCFSIRRRQNPVASHEHSRLNREGRAFLRKYATSGESGEMLLYLLVEAVLKAPQLIAKMELKTNRRMELHGSDGIHMKWDEVDEILDIYFGEAKLEQTVYSALDNVFESLKKFHAEGTQSHEFGLVTSHYKYADEEMKQVVLRLLDRQSPGGDVRINHACLVGYDWEEYKELTNISPAKIHEEFCNRYRADIARLKDLINTRFSNFSHKHLRFEVFFLPFPSVQDFRDAFNDCV